MDLRIVFTRYDASFISRAIMWFTQRKTNPERRCSHVLIKFRPRGVFEERWAAFEAMERGCWLSMYEHAIGKGTVVAEFEVLAPNDAKEGAVREALDRYLSWSYDYAGIGIWALWILLKRWAATPLKWFNVVFRPGKADDALFCSGLALRVLQEVQERAPGIDFGLGELTPRTSTPRNEIDICFGYPEAYRPTDE
jgi:hypothetical protein